VETKEVAGPQNPATPFSGTLVVTLMAPHNSDLLLH
jgi:hypothetical protein